MTKDKQYLGELPPMRVRKQGILPDRREVSKRWLVSTIIVGVTSSLLMGGALMAALEGRQLLTIPAQAYERGPDNNGPLLAFKGNHPGLIKKLLKEKSNVIMASTISKSGDTNIVKARPFIKIKAPLGVSRKLKVSYPKFNPLTVISDNKIDQDSISSNDFLYGAEVEGEVSLNILDFPYDTIGKKLKSRQRSVDIERQVRQIAANIGDQDAYISALTYFDVNRFSGDSNFLLTSVDVTITPENVTALERTSNSEYQGTHYEERLIEIRADASIEEIFLSEGLSQEQAKAISNILSSDLGNKELKKGDTLQAWFENKTQTGGDTIKSIAKVSMFRKGDHLVSIANTDDKHFVYALKPESAEELVDAAAQRPTLAKSQLPTMYDGLYRAAMDEGLTEKLAGSLIKIFAFDLDFQSRVTQHDQLEIFLTLEDGKEVPTENSEILYAGLQFGNQVKRYYRYQNTENGFIGYYDHKGKSAKKFLLRKPVPNGKFRSKYGMRRHPISRRYKLHGGVDWSAPRGTPIVAAGNGKVEKAAWAGGNGKRTILRHANGYETYYLHQAAFAKGIKPGVRVRQGQVIGYVGSTGYSTGPHLHYEVHVNGNRVDPMRIKLPKSQVLKGAELQRFLSEKDRIDMLVNDGKSIETAQN